MPDRLRRPRHLDVVYQVAKPARRFSDFKLVLDSDREKALEWAVHPRIAYVPLQGTIDEENPLFPAKFHRLEYAVDFQDSSVPVQLDADAMFVERVEAEDVITAMASCDVAKQRRLCPITKSAKMRAMATLTDNIASGIGLQHLRRWHHRRRVASANRGRRSPVRVADIDISSAGRGTRMLLGDLDGDGRMEMVLKQPDGGIDDRYAPHEVQSLTAFDLDGRQLWQVGTPDPTVQGSDSDMPAQIWDIDNDGQLEVLCVMDDQFLVLDGMTGGVKQVHELPDPDAHDCIVICNLTGGEHAQDIILKDRYRRMWALDKDFNLLWTHEGNLGHFPWPHDFDGDGCDEIMAGYDLLNHNGTRLWTCEPLEEHADCIWIGNLDDERQPGHIVIGGSATVMYDRQGRERWRYNESTESQHVALGRFRADSPEILVAGLDRIERGGNGIDGMFILSPRGEPLWKEERVSRGWTTIIDSVRNWDDSPQDYILAYRRGGGLLPGLYDGYGDRVVTFPLDGNVTFADLTGCGRQDVIVYTDERASIFSSERRDITRSTTGDPLPQTKRLSHTTLYPGGEYPYK